MPRDQQPLKKSFHESVEVAPGRRDAFALPGIKRVWKLIPAGTSLGPKLVPVLLSASALPLSGCAWFFNVASNGLDYGGKPLPPAPPPVAAAPTPPPAPPCQPPLPGESITLEGCRAGDTIVLHGVNFEFNKAALTPNAKSLLDPVADALLAQPGIRIEIDGHTDGIGGDAYNLKLSEARSLAVKDYLVSRGVAASRLSAKGFGKSQPVADNGTEEGRELNRRVELKVLEPTAAAAQPLPMPAPVAAAAPAAGNVAIENMKFVPAELTVAVGATVTWTNHDAGQHSVKFADQAGPLLAGGSSFSKTFAKPGEYWYQCGVHSQMTGKIVVK